MKDYCEGWQEIEPGQQWRHKSGGRVATVVKQPLTTHGYVFLKHESGRITTKQVRYFMYDYERVAAGDD